MDNDIAHVRSSSSENESDQRRGRKASEKYLEARKKEKKSLGLKLLRVSGR